ncbi:hypothetical protein OHB00_43650 [Streptomyces sp. NBC_00631]|uniref:hypothetical protein n=1 Tax=Streptomyces sp. NBC_00631 TaxID=2975793 RepID=UPI0030DF2DA9
MRTRTAVTAALILLAGTATACTGGPAVSKAPGTASTAPTAAKALALGSGRHWKDIDGDGSRISATTTAVGYTQPAKGVNLPTNLADAPDAEWAVLEVRTCADADSTNVIVAQSPWTLRLRNGTPVKPLGLAGHGIPAPVYPVSGEAVRPGTCLRGKITFAVPRGSRPDRIVYDVQRRPAVTWSVPRTQGP